MIVEDRFFEPETIPFDELLRVDYEIYLENLEDGEEPLSYKEFKEVNIW
jgi:hypothetical protein